MKKILRSIIIIILSLAGMNSFASNFTDIKSEKSASESPNANGIDDWIKNH